MANRTVKDAKSIKGTNPQYLVEKIIRSRIYDSKYWKEECFALTAELLVDKAMELRFVGGVFGGNIKPTPFLCLTLKMLQIQPEKDIIVEFIKNEEFKYVRALGAFYMRLTGTSMDCYSYLEPLLNDYRKLRRQNREGAYEVVYVDEYVDELLREERACDIILPRMQKRNVLEETNQLPPHISVLEEDEDDDDDEDMEEEELKEEKLKAESSRSSKKLASKSSKSSKSSSSKGDREGRRRHRSDTSHSASSDDYVRKEKSDHKHDKDRPRKESSDSRSQRKDKKKDRDLEYERRDKDRDKTRDRGREYDGRRRDAEPERERGHHHRDRDRDSDRHRSSRRHDY